MISVKKIAAAGALFAAAVSANADAVSFRYDDNQSVEIWQTLADVFRKHDARFGLSLIPCSFGADNAEWCKLICQLESEGFEIYDHTPQHNTLSMRLPEDSPLLKELANAPFVDHINGNKVCLKYDLGSSTVIKTVKIDIRNKNEIVCKTPGATINHRSMLDFNGKQYYAVQNKDKLQIYSIWGENNIEMPDTNDVEVKVLKHAFRPYPGAVDFLVKQSQAGFRKIGLKKMPTVWIQPGGLYPHYETEGLGEVLLKHGYVSASTASFKSAKGFNDPDLERSAFAMRWGDFNLENLNLQLAKYKIARATACHRVAIGSSHVTPARRGKLKEYAALHDELLVWLKKNNIKVMTQSELALYLRDHKIDADKNIMPAFSRDIDGNGRPDGYDLARKTSFSNGAFNLVHMGNLLSINKLCGLPQGKVKFTADWEGTFAGQIKFIFIGSKGRVLGQQIIPVEFSKSKGVKSESVFDIPKGTVALQFIIISNNAKSKAVLKNLDLRAAK